MPLLRGRRTGLGRGSGCGAVLAVVVVLVAAMVISSDIFVAKRSMFHNVLASGEFSLVSKWQLQPAIVDGRGDTVVYDKFNNIFVYFLNNEENGRTFFGNTHSYHSDRTMFFDHSAHPITVSAMPRDVLYIIKMNSGQSTAVDGLPQDAAEKLYSELRQADRGDLFEKIIKNSTTFDDRIKGKILEEISRHRK